MTYVGRVQNGVVVFDGPERPRDGAVVRVDEMADAQREKQAGETPNPLEALAGKAVGLPSDLAQRHDHYRREKRAS